jgi:Papain family cysteine protease
MRAFVIAIMLLCSVSGSQAQTPKKTGLIFTDREQYLSIPPAPPPLQGPPPAMVDLTEYGYFPEPGDQGNQGSCVAWAIAYGLKSYQKNREFRLQNAEANFRFSPAFIFNQVKGDNCNDGSRIVDALNILESQGALTLEDFSYDQHDCAKAPTEAQIQRAWEYRIAKWMRVNVQSRAEVKAQITRGFPIIIAMNVYKSFMNWTGNGVYKYTPKASDPNVGGHAMLVVGYADQLKAFKVLNSWGSGWGDKGYAWIDYTTFQALVAEGYVTIDIFLQRPIMSKPPMVSQPATVENPKLAVESPPPRKSMRSRSFSASALEPQAGETTSTPPLETPGDALTPAVVTASVRSSTEPKLVAKWRGFAVYPYSVWLDLPSKTAATVASVEYWFNHPTFRNPKRSVEGSNIFIAKWSGYGCISDAKAIVTLKDGSKVEAPFDLCDAQRRF